jgi:hypothetical protein
LTPVGTRPPEPLGWAGKSRRCSATGSVVLFGGMKPIDKALATAKRAKVSEDDLEHAILSAVRRDIPAKNIAAAHDAHKARTGMGIGEQASKLWPDDGWATTRQRLRRIATGEVAATPDDIKRMCKLWGCEKYKFYDPRAKW